MLPRANPLTRASGSLFFAALVALGLPRSASAAPANAAPATKLFDDGKAALDRGDTATACAKLEESQTLDPSPGTLFFWSECESKRGHVAKAWALLRELEDTLPPSDPRHGQVRQNLAAITLRIAYVVVTVQGGPAPKDLAILCDDTKVGGSSNLGAPIPVEVGTRRIALRVLGRVDAVKSVEAASGASVPVALGIGAPTTRTRFIAGVTLGAVGVAAVGAGIGLGFAGKSKFDATAADCTGSLCSQDGAAARSSAVALGNAGTALVVVGAAAVGAGLLVWLLAPTDEGGLRAQSSAALGISPGYVGVKGSF